MSLAIRGLLSVRTTSQVRIAFVLPGRGLSGGNRVVVAYGNRLIERGHDVTIACLRWRVQRRPKAILRRLRADARSLLGLDRDHVDDFKGRLISTGVADLPRRLPDGDAVLATHWLTADPVAALPASKGEKFYFLQHYEAPFFNPPDVDATWRLPMRKIVISTWLQELARDRFNDPEVVLIPNGIDTELFDAPPRGLHQPPAVGVLFSRQKWKGSAVAFEAVRIVRRRLPGLRLICFGAEAPIPSLPLPSGTSFYLRPAQQQIRHIYASADVWLCASTTEGFALPPLEAMACRCPVVSTRCGGPLDFVEEGVNGHLVDVGDAAGMAERMLDILSDPARWQRMSESAYATAARYTWDKATDLFEAALQRAIARNRRGELAEKTQVEAGAG